MSLLSFVPVMGLPPVTGLPPTQGMGRQLLQGDAPDSTLPNLFNLPVCSRFGSHSTSFLVDMPRARPKIFVFGPQDIDVHQFHPYSSVYMEPVVVLMIPGLVLWLMLLCACTCFCYRRYRLGLCGEPIPTVKAYTPREICVSMTVVAVGCVLIVLASGAAVLVANASYEGAFDSLLAAGQSAEGALNSSISEGAEVLDAGLRMSASLDGFQKLLATEVDATALGSDLQCSLDLLAALPNGATMLRTASAIGDATVVFPEDAVTDALFADLRRPQQRYPALVPPLQVSLANLQDRLAALPDLVLLADRLERLNTSVLNTSSVPSRIAAAMVGVNATLALLPDLSLLADRLSRVSHEQTGSEPHICASLPPGWQPGDVTECDLLQAQLRQARDTVERVDPELPLSLFSSYESLAADFLTSQRSPPLS